MPPAETMPWPASVAGTPSVAVIERAIARRRLSHSLLLTGDSVEALQAVALAIADRLLRAEAGAAGLPGLEPPAHPPEQHPDFFALRPTGKMRQISADATRGLIGRVQVSPTVAPQKVAVIHECDRMNLSAANIFLKTLEEPPANTTLLLLTTRPYALLPTIRSRCLHFRFPVDAAGFTPDGWTAWLQDYQAWLGKLTEGVADRKAAADSVFSAYGLVARFGAILDFASGEAWASQKEKLPPELSEEEQTAMEAGLANGLRARLFAEIEKATRAYALGRLREGDAATRRSLTAAIDRLERAVGLLRVNLNESAALEDFLLASLRLWSRK